MWYITQLPKMKEMQFNYGEKKRSSQIASLQKPIDFLLLSRKSPGFCDDAIWDNNLSWAVNH